MPQTLNLKEFKTKYGHYKDVIVNVSCYFDGKNPAITVTSDEGEPLTTLTVNPYGTAPNDADCVWLRDYTECEGIPAQLQQLELVEPTDRIAAVGYHGAVTQYRMKGELLDTWHRFQKEELPNVG